MKADPRISYYVHMRALEDMHEWEKWTKEIPFIEFPEGYEFKPLPPFAGAVARFFVRKKGSKRHVSVYFDPYMNLGCMSEPYFEIYPAPNGDVERFFIKDKKKMVRQIVKVLSKKPSQLCREGRNDAKRKTNR